MTWTRARLPIRWVARWIAVLTLALFGTIGLAGAAGAHTDLTGSDPAQGGTLGVPPAAITLTFNEPVQNFEPVVALTGPDGQPYPTSPPVVDSAVVRSDVGGLGPAGTYTIAYRVVSVDGHPVTGQLQFEFAPANPPVTEALPAPATLASAASTLATAADPATPDTSVSSVTSSTSAQPSRSTAAATVATTDTSPAELAVTAAEQSAGVSGWVWAAIVGVLVVVTAALAVVVRQRRQQAGGE